MSHPDTPVTGGPLTAQLTLAQWLSPAFPVGAFSYSHGLEAAIDQGIVTDAAGMTCWLSGVLRDGGGWSDAVLLAAAYHTDDPAEIDALARALAPSSERLMETALQGAAFAGTVGALDGRDLGELTYPVAVGTAAARHGLPLDQTLAMYLHGFASNLVSAAIRLVPLGQTEGQRIITDLAPLCADLAERAATSTPDDLGGCAWAADIAAMSHETQHVRLFRS